MDEPQPANEIVFVETSAEKSGAHGAGGGASTSSEAYRPGPHNRDAIARMLHASKHTLKGNALFHELSRSDKKKSQQSKGHAPIDASASCSMPIDDYQSGEGEGVREGEGMRARA